MSIFKTLQDLKLLLYQDGNNYVISQKPSKLPCCDCDIKAVYLLIQVPKHTVNWRKL